MIIPLNGWAAGERKFHSHAGIEFFHTFDNTEILDANVQVEVTVRKEAMRKVEAILHLQGTVTVPCDRCLEPLVLPVDAKPSFSIIVEGEEYQPTAVTVNEARKVNTPSATYSVGGLHLSDTQAAPKGIYIQDRKKYIRK